MATVELGFIFLITYLWVKKGVPNNKFYFWITALESFCILNYVIFAMLNVNREKEQPITGVLKLYELLVLCLFLLIVLCQVLQIIGEVIYYAV
jgi:hypothetical protein